MKFGAVAPKEAIGATAVHTIRQGAMVLKKGTLIGPVEAAALEAAGIKDIVVARLEVGDVSEDVAAADIAEAIAGDGVHVDRAFTGRANWSANGCSRWVKTWLIWAGRPRMGGTCAYSHFTSVRYLSWFHTTFSVVASSLFTSTSSGCPESSRTKAFRLCTVSATR